jgi:hypothetical protein
VVNSKQLRYQALGKGIAVVVTMLLVLVGAISDAAADPDRMALLITGSETPRTRQVITSTIDGVARERGVVLAPQSFTAKDVSTITGCVTAAQPWTCIASVVRGKGIQQLAVVTLSESTSKDGSPMLVITEQLLVASLDMATGAQRFCVRCTDDVLAKSTSELTSGLFQEIAVHSGRTVVAISSTPRGARITFDGKSMGATDRSFNTFPGTHTVTLELDGYQRESRSISTTIDTTSEVTLTMRPVTPAGPLADPSAIGKSDQRPSSLGPKIVVGVGGLAIIAGGIGLAFNQKSESAPVGSPQREHYYDTTAPSIAFLVGGGVVSACGLLWWHHTNSKTVPTVAPAPGGAVVGLITTF